VADAGGCLVADRGQRRAICARGSRLHRLRTAVRTMALPLDVPAGWY
jgi:hypothetical protein